MKKSIIAVAIAALGIFGCQKSTSEDVANQRQDLAATRADANKQMADARTDGSKEVADAQKDAAQKEADARADAQKQVADKKNDLVKTEQDAAAKNGAPVTVVGRVADVKDDGFKLHTNEGRDLNLKMGRDVAGTTLQEGEEVRASFRQVNGDDVVQHLDVLDATPVKK